MYSPLPDQLSLAKSSIHGLGLFAKEPLKRGTKLGISHIAHENFPNGWIRTPLGGFYNHSNTPNCRILNIKLQDGTPAKMLITLVDIDIDEELTCTYTIWKATPEMTKYKWWKEETIDGRRISMYE